MIVINKLTHITGISSSFNSAISKPIKQAKLIFCMFEVKSNLIMKKLILLSAFLIFACQKPTKISEKEIMDTFENFFEVLDNDLDSLHSLVTDDFFIFENSRRYTKDEFIAFVKSFDIVSSKRKFENITIDRDYNSAHISLKQFGEFIVNTPEGRTKLEFEWLESTYAVKEGDTLKFKFYFSEAVKTNATNLDAEQAKPQDIFFF